MDPSSIQALASLLKPPGAEGDDDELDVTSTTTPYATPGTIGPPVKNEIYSGSLKGESTATSKDIWVADEVLKEEQIRDFEDHRPQPVYDMIFKQAVGTQDIFLGMGPKNPSTACCEHLLVKIQLPGADAKDLELDITDNFIDCRTPKYKLGLHLPDKVNSKESKAKWISDKEELHVTLLLDREYDFMNKI